MNQHLTRYKRDSIWGTKSLTISSQGLNLSPGPDMELWKSRRPWADGGRECQAVVRHEGLGPMSRKFTGLAPQGGRTKEGRGKSLDSPRIWSVKEVVCGWRPLPLWLCRVSRALLGIHTTLPPGKQQEQAHKAACEQQDKAVSLSEPHCADRETDEA